MDSPAAHLLATAQRVTPTWARDLIAKSASGFATGLDDERVDRVVRTVTEFVLDELRQLLELDPDEQRANPLSVFRRATAPITALLSDLGVPPAVRDEFEQRSFPHDVYGLSPATWADISPELVEPGLEWGAWKAAVIISRHRPKPSAGHGQ